MIPTTCVLSVSLSSFSSTQVIEDRVDLMSEPAKIILIREITNYGAHFEIAIEFAHP